MHSMSDFGYVPSGYGKCQVCGSFEINCCDGKGGPFKIKYAGLWIIRGEDGYCAQNGHEYAADNEPTLEGAKAAIDDYWAGDEHGPLNGIFGPSE